MGCSGSKAEDLPLVIRCRERQELIRAAANHRYALAAAHVSYFRSLKDVGDALRKFVDEELVTTTPSSSSSFSSPSLILPPSSKKKHDDADESSLHLHDDEDEEESHLHISDSSSEDVDSEDFEHRHHIHHGHESEDDAHQHHNHQAHVHKGKGFDDEVRHSHNEEESSSRYPRGVFNGYGSGFGDGMVNDPNANPYPYPYPFPRRSVLMKSAPATKTVVHQPPADPAYGYSDSYWNYPAGYGSAGYGGVNFSMGSPVRMGVNEGVKMNSQKEAPPPPSPKASTWDFFNPFDVYDNGYPGYYSSGRYGYASNSSSPDSTEVREREGIPDLEEETENEVYKEVLKGNRMKADARRSSGESTPRTGAMPVRKNGNASSGPVPQHNTESSSRSVPLYRSEDSSRSLPPHKSESSSRSLPSWSSEESEKPSLPQKYNRENAKPSMRRDEKSSSENIVLKSVDEGSVKKKGVTFEVGETSKQDAESSKLSSVTLLSPRGTRDLREVVAEIRDEFETASSYGKEVAMMLEVGKLPYQPSFLKELVLGVGPVKSLRSELLDSDSKKWLTIVQFIIIINADSIALLLLVILSRILCLISPSVSLQDPPSMQSIKLAFHNEVGKDEEILRIAYEKQCKRLKTLDEEGAESSKIDATRASIRKLLTKLDVSIKAIDAISSRIHKLRDEELEPQVAALIHGSEQTDPLTDTSSRATTELERELRAWCERFNEWISSQKSYVESLNGWLLQCLQYEPEETPDGPVPVLPGRLGAPPIFIICNDWQQAMEAVSEARVANAMNTGKIKLEQDAMSDNTRLSVSDNGVSRLDDLKVDLDSMRQKLAEERIKHKDAMKLVHDAASSSLQGGLVPIFKALENFTSEALKAHEHVRLQHPEQSS
ncbi:hypothetical protein Sango_2169400 [Sesamum angolense]|uniref:Uncharacterized protein n=1 Tax=Sesamum angolense TaxID=2727404 RepID=A0AAE1WD12_9LAMI|nr:hypothetical protein Sango_2169400 [Sesamum angolense]